MARFEIGDVLLTTRMSNVFLRFRQPVLARNTPLAEFHSKCVMVQGRQPCGLAKGKPAPTVVAASQFDLHVALPLSRSDGEMGKRLLVEFKRNAHAKTLAFFYGGVNSQLRWLRPCQGSRFLTGFGLRASFWH